MAGAIAVAVLAASVVSLMCFPSTAVSHVTQQGLIADEGYSCSDVAPEYYTCAEHKEFGNCNDPSMTMSTNALPQGFCQTTCGRCPNKSSAVMLTDRSSKLQSHHMSQPETSTHFHTSQLARSRSLLASCSCTDTQPDSTYTCAQQKAFGKCSSDFVAGKGFCQATCGRCQCNPSCSCDDVRPPGAFSCAQQKAFGKCSEAFMKKGSLYAPVASKGYCRITCGACNCDTAQSGNPTPTTTRTPATRSPSSQSSPTTPTQTSPASSSRTSPTPRTATTTSPSSASTARGPPAPLSAAYLARCQCTDAPPPSARSCAEVLTAGHCDVYETIVGNKQHPEGFCQQTCNRCNNYCVPKGSGSAPATPATPATSSSTPGSPGCSDNPPDNKFTCAQQKSYGQCGQSFMTKGNYCLKTCGQCFRG